MVRIIPFFRIKYETRLGPSEVLKRIRGKVAMPEWRVTLPRMIQYRIMTGKIIGNEFELSNNRYGLTHGRANFLLIMKGTVRAEKQSGLTIIDVAVRPSETIVWLYSILSVLMILLARYVINKGLVLPAIISIFFVVAPYLSLLSQLSGAIDSYRRFMEEEIL